MKRLLLALLLFSSPVLAEKYTIYTTERPPFSWSGTIDDDNTFYYFTNAYEPKCDIVARGCFMKTNEKAEIINKNIILVKNRYGEDRYFCSEEHIQAVKKLTLNLHLFDTQLWIMDMENALKMVG